MFKKLQFEYLQKINTFIDPRAPKFLSTAPLYFECILPDYEGWPRQPAIRVLSTSAWYFYSRLGEERDVQGCRLDNILIGEVARKAQTRFTLFYKDFSKYLVPASAYHNGLSKFYNDHGLMPDKEEMWTLPDICGEVPW